MAEERPLDGYLTGVGVAGLGVRLDHTLQAATLRYFARDGAFASAVHALTGLALPQTLCATAAPDGRLVLAWRSPTETLCLTPDTARLGDLAARLANYADGCLVNLSGALKVVRLSGDKVPDLLCRLGGTASVPRPGEARRSRLADVPALAVCMGGAGAETLLLVDRAYAPHVLGWIRATLDDWS